MSTNGGSFLNSLIRNPNRVWFRTQGISSLIFASTNPDLGMEQTCKAGRCQRKTVEFDKVCKHKLKFSSWQVWGRVYVIANPGCSIASTTQSHPLSLSGWRLSSNATHEQMIQTFLRESVSFFGRNVSESGLCGGLLKAGALWALLWELPCPLQEMEFKASDLRALRFSPGKKFWSMVRSHLLRK